MLGACTSGQAATESIGMIFTGRWDSAARADDVDLEPH